MKFYKKYSAFVSEDLSWVNDVLIGLGSVFLLKYLVGVFSDIVRNKTSFARTTNKIIVLKLALSELKLNLNHPEDSVIEKRNDNGEEKIFIKRKNVKHALILNLTNKTMYFENGNANDVFELTDDDIDKIKSKLKI